MLLVDEEVKETDNESSKSSSDVPDYPDYVMSDPKQRDKILSQMVLIKKNMSHVRTIVDEAF